MNTRNTQKKINTRNHQSPRRRAAVGSAVVLALMLAAGSAFAQNAQPRRGNDDARNNSQETDQRRERPALRGPAVTDDRAPGARRSFGDSANQPGQGAPQADRLSPGALRIIMQDLANPEVANQLQLTERQREAIQAHVAEFQSQTRQHAERNRQEAARLREQLRQREEAGDPMDDQSPARERVRARMTELRESAPSPDQLFTRVWSELNDDQRTIVRQRMDELRARADAEREERYVRSRTGRDADSAAPAPRTPPERPLPPAAGERRRPGMESSPQPDRQPDARRERPQPPQPQRIDPERRDRLLRAFSRLSPEQQDRILQRLENLSADQAEPQPESRPAPGANPDRRPLPPRMAPDQPPHPPQRRGEPGGRQAQPDDREPQRRPAQPPQQRRQGRD